MDNIDSAERARLIRLGNYAQHHLQKLLAFPLPAGSIEVTRLLGMPAIRLLSLGQILGNDGVIFTQRGGEVAAHPRFGHNPIVLRMTITSLVNCYHQRHGVEAGRLSAVFDELWARVHAANGSDASSPVEQELTAAIKGEFMLLLGPATEAAKMIPGCAFCGEKAGHDRKLLVCGRCKNALYCDKWCQSKDWKEHKTTCKEKQSGESKDEESEGGSKPAEDANGREYTDTTGGSREVESLNGDK